MFFPPDSVPDGLPLDTQKALLLVDLQNDFVSPTGKLAVANVDTFLSKLPSLVAKFRTKGEVIWAGTEYRHPRSSISPDTGTYSILPRPFLGDGENQGVGDLLYQRETKSSSLHATHDPLGGLGDMVYCRDAFLMPTPLTSKHRCCLPGTDGIQYPDLLAEAIDTRHDLVLLKSHYSAFTDTALLTHLRTRLITQLYICGSLSNISVYATVLDAVRHGMQVTIIEDCLGYSDELCHVEAMRQMADGMGANGIDYQELMDDLADLLGDVIHETDFTHQFEVSLMPSSSAIGSLSRAQHISDWISTIESRENDDASTVSPDYDGIPSNIREDVASCDRESGLKDESLTPSHRPVLDGQSPPAKRSTSDLDDEFSAERTFKLSHKPSSRCVSGGTSADQQLKRKQNKAVVRKQRRSHESSDRSLTPSSITPMAHSHARERFGDGGETSSEGQGGARLDNVGRRPKPSRNRRGRRKQDQRAVRDVLGPNDVIGEGDCRLVVDLLPPLDASAIFYRLKSNVGWQTMLHRSGAVPRLVAVQGQVSEDGRDVPIYRHPADESPELLPFDPTVETLRKAAEEVAGHPLNHVLIQWYRDGEDNVSEHSDKTLDIVRGSSIVNFSLGAQRMMTLRKKKSAMVDGPEASRTSQRLPLPHNSLFMLGQDTNQHWLHSIRPDKRPTAEKSSQELAFEGERISLTFRHIGTFIDTENNIIWGQGATVKTKEGAKKLLEGTEAEKVGEALIIAFGQENHRSRDWDWDECYGQGFDVVNFVTKEG